MMSDEDELYTKVVVLNDIYNFVFFLIEIIWMSKYTPQDFIELIPKEYHMLHSHNWVWSGS